MSIKLQTTIVSTRDDWSVARFELLANISRQKNADFGSRLFAITTSDRKPLEAADPILTLLNRGDFDGVWLSTVDTAAGVRHKEYAGTPEFCTVHIDWASCQFGADSELQHVEVAGGSSCVRVDAWFNLAVAFEGSRGKGRFIAKCSFNRASREPAGDASVRVYVGNVAAWLALLESDEWESLAWNRSLESSVHAGRS